MKDNMTLPPRGLALVPVLMAPVLIGALWLVLVRDAITPRALIVGGAMAFAWYLLGGMIALSRLVWEIRLRRDLRRSHAQLNALSEPAWLLDPQGRVLAQNDAAARRHDLVGRDMNALVGRYRAMPETAVNATLARMTGRHTGRIDLGDGISLAISRKPGSEIQLWALEHCVPEDEQPAQIADFDTLPVALVRLTVQGLIVNANPPARALLGEDAVGRSVAALLDGPGRPIVDWLADTAAGICSPRPEVLYLQRGGAERYLQVTLTREADGGLVAVLLDVSAMKTLEAQVVQSQKMQAIGQLAGGIAHDFNNLLTAITGHCDLLMLRHDKGDQDYADLYQIEVNANRAAALVRQLLAFSRKQTLNPQVLDLRDTLSDLTHLLNRLVGERITLNFTHDPQLCTVRADKRQFEQVVMNLVVNARDAMPAGGEITIITRNVHLGEEERRDNVSIPPGDYVLVSVTDQGVGIPADQLGKIFEPFFTTKRPGEGTGLGLSTVYGIVKQTGGYIFCDSRESEGTTFSLYFPVNRFVPPGPAEPEPEPEAMPLEDESASILLVEDEGPVRAFAARALRLRGYDVHEVDSGEAALALLADDRVRIDLFVTDVIMPGLDGPSWVRTALRKRRDTRVIFMSGYTDTAMIDPASSIRGSVFLPKPFSLSELVACAERQLAARPQAAGRTAMR